MRYLIGCRSLKICSGSAMLLLLIFNSAFAIAGMLQGWSVRVRVEMERTLDRSRGGFIAQHGNCQGPQY